MERWRKQLQDNLQVTLEDDDSEHLFASTFMNQIQIHSEI
jgi:hypothetical protein